jgi:uncharacterized alpha-E superfamily protein
MLSRVANSLYWMARYIERAENLARMIDVGLMTTLDSRLDPQQADTQYWQPVLRANALDDAFATLQADRPGLSILEFLTLSPGHPDSIHQCVTQARENARMARDQVSVEMWRELNRLYLFVTSPAAADLWRANPQDFYAKITASSLLIQAIADATISRNQGWYFIHLGRFLERADQTSRILDLGHHAPRDSAAAPTADHSAGWGAILRSCSARVAYRQLYGGLITRRNVADLLLFSRTFPRSVRFCIHTVDSMLHEISGTARGDFSNPAEKVAGACLAKLNYSGAADTESSGLHDYLDSLQLQFNEIGARIFETYVLLPAELTSLGPVPRSLWETTPEPVIQQQQQQQQ